MTTGSVRALTSLLLVGALLASVAPGGATAAPLPSPEASPAVCPVTRPNGDMPPGSGNPRFIGGLGNDALWTNLWMWGEGPVLVQADPARPGATRGPGKWAWYRYVPGELTIEGRRLDAPAPQLVAQVPDGYGPSGFQVSGLSFPTIGCWEVTGRVGDASLTFVVRVTLAAPDPPPTTT